VLLDERTARSVHLPPSIHAVSNAPHDWLFPRVSVTMHHAGAGTVAAALRAGAPMLAAPIAVDQFFWSRRVEALGVGRVLRRRSFSARAVAEALVETARDRRLRQRAGQIRQALAAEDGTSRAVELMRQAINF